MDLHRYTPPRPLRLAHRCWACAAPGTTLQNGRYYCSNHIRIGWEAVTPAHVQAARTLLRRGESLQQIAVLLNVGVSDLDQGLWRHIADPLGRQPKGMF